MGSVWKHSCPLPHRRLDDNYYRYRGITSLSGTEHLTRSDTWTAASQEIQPAEFISNRPVTLARGTLQFLAVGDCHYPPRVLDHSRPLQQACRKCHGSSWRSQHGRKEVMRQAQSVSVQAVMTS